MLTQILPSYTYVQYNDDGDILAFKDAYNALAQGYMDWFVTANLPNYNVLTGGLLQWIGAGLYGYALPSLPLSGISYVGPLNTWQFDSLTLNTMNADSGGAFVVVTDDIYRRCLTWNFYKGDGSEFSISWLKRRIARFLGTPDAYRISVQFGFSAYIPDTRRTVTQVQGPSAQYDELQPNTVALNDDTTVPQVHTSVRQVPRFDLVNIHIVNSTRVMGLTAMFNELQFDGWTEPGTISPTYTPGTLPAGLPLMPADPSGGTVAILTGSSTGTVTPITLNELRATITPLTRNPLDSILDAGIRSGALALPFQYEYHFSDY